MISRSVQILMRNIKELKYSRWKREDDYILYKISRFGWDLPGEDPCRGGQDGADGPDGENHQQNLHPPRLGGQRPHDGLQERY